MRARFAELRAAEREGVPGFQDVCLRRPNRMPWGLVGVAAVLLVMVGISAAMLLRGSQRHQQVAEWPQIEIELPEEAMNDSPTAVLLTYCDEAAGTMPASQGLN